MHIMLRVIYENFYHLDLYAILIQFVIEPISDEDVQSMVRELVDPWTTKVPT